MKDQYDRLLKIKVPVLISVLDVSKRHPGQDYKKNLDRTRILYPNGNCEYAYEYLDQTEMYHGCFHLSCFVSIDANNNNPISLADTVAEMRRYDVNARIIHKIQEIK